MFVGVFLAGRCPESELGLFPWPAQQRRGGHDRAGGVGNHSLLLVSQLDVQPCFASTAFAS